jgi:DNA repair protein RecN (Recombination protein N)
VLRTLSIKNLVLIKEAKVSFGEGLNAVTGETGAGKSVFGHAFGLLLGNKAGAEMVGPHGQEAYVEAEFDLPEGLLEDEELADLFELRDDDEPGLILGRRVTKDGRSRAYAWGRSISRETLAAVGERLLSMSGQFEQRRLAKAAYQLDLLDAFVGEAQSKRLEGAARAWKTLQATRRRHEELLADRAGHEARVVEMRLLVKASADFDVGEEEVLLQERQKLLRVNDLLMAAQAAAEALSPELADGAGAADLAGQAERTLGPVRSVDPELDAIAVQLIEAEESLRDGAQRLRSYLSSLEAEPGRLEAVDGRLFQFTDVLRRFRAQTYADLLERRDCAQEELLSVDSGEDPLERVEGELAEAQVIYDKASADLRKARQKAVKGFEKAVREELSQLGMGEGELKVELAERAPGHRGADEVAFLVKPNAGLPFAPVAQTASGGELSRIALALRVVSHTRSGEGTIVFDEIDAGVGGVTAHAVAESLRRLGERSQVLTITHLPQIASVAGTHLVVTKIAGDPTQTEVGILDDEERKQELERMLGGSEFLSTLGSG